MTDIDCNQMRETLVRYYTSYVDDKITPELSKEIYHFFMTYMNSRMIPKEMVNAINLLESIVFRDIPHFAPPTVELAKEIIEELNALKF